MLGLQQRYFRSMRKTLTAAKAKAVNGKTINDMTELGQIACIKYNVWRINEIIDPTAKIQMLAVEGDPATIYEIRNPTTEARDFALSQLDPCMVALIRPELLSNA